MRALLLLFLLSSAVCLPAADPQLKVVLKDGSIVRGTLVGSDETSLTLETKEGRAREIPRARIKKAYDADTLKPYDFEGAAKPARDEETAEEPKPKAKPAPRFSEDDGEGGEEAAEQPKPRGARAKAQAQREKAAQGVSLRSTHEWVDLGFNFQMGYNIGDDSAIAKQWKQMDPSGGKLDWGSHSTRMHMGLETDVLARPIPWLGVGAFGGWNFWAPGAEGELKWTTTGYWWYNGYYWYYYPSGSWTTKHQLTYQNIVYGGRLSGWLPLPNPNGRDETGRVSFEISYGQLQLAGANARAWKSGSLVQQVDLYGAAPFLSTSVGMVVASSKNTAMDVKFGYQTARITKVTAKIVHDDYVPANEGKEYTLTDGPGGPPIYVDFSTLYMSLGLVIMF